jgi:hypothetical protein
MKEIFELPKTGLAATVNSTNYLFINIQLPSMPEEKNMLLGIKVSECSITQRDLLCLRDIEKQSKNGVFQTTEIKNSSGSLSVTMLESEMNKSGKKIAVAKICQSHNEPESFELSQDDAMYLFDTLIAILAKI